jgi:hypothetical protein
MKVLKRGTGFGLSSGERHLARENRAISQEMPQGITGKMPVPRYFATPSKCAGSTSHSRRMIGILVIPANHPLPVACDVANRAPSFPDAGGVDCIRLIPQDLQSHSMLARLL